MNASTASGSSSAAVPVPGDLYLDAAVPDCERVTVSRNGWSAPVTHVWTGTGWARLVPGAVRAVPSDQPVPQAPPARSVAAPVPSRPVPSRPVPSRPVPSPPAPTDTTPAPARTRPAPRAPRPATRRAVSDAAPGQPVLLPRRVRPVAADGAEPAADGAELVTSRRRS